MLFSSAIFLFIFLPLILLVYFFTPTKLKNACLLVASLGFYTFGEKELVLLILASTIVDFSAGIIIEKGFKKLGLGLSILTNLSFLLYFKYTSFLYENYYDFLDLFQLQSTQLNNFPNIILPLGISFYTFQTMSYTIDVYRGNVKANRNFINFATYVTLFPQLIAGPIVRYKDIQKQLINRNQNIKQFSEGVERFIIGLVKKMLIANNLAFVADGIFDTPTDLISSPIAWIGVIAYAFQIYYDFSGYSDMAIGLGKMFGFDFLENFNYPYISKSIKEFWRRWHISLSTWFRDYLYISLGGNRKGKIRTYINLITVFFITGLWHGANYNFIIWGLLHGLFLIIERLGFDKVLLKLGKPISHIYTLLVVLITWVFFKTETLTDALNYILQMFNFSMPKDINLITYYMTKEVFLAFILAIVFSFPIYPYFENKIANKTFYLYLKPISLIVLFIISILYIAVDSYNPFIYFRF
ncbi:MAG: MBOAT family protein [Flavobacteriaceae bacterium]|nr:MBOAT family protein [Flavobacteriaceae bacterium]